MTSVTQFDNVRIVNIPAMESLSYAGKLGVCYGFTTPSVTGVEVVGGRDADFALAVHFKDSGTDVWFSPDLVEFVDHAPGTTISVNGYSAVRQADGRWKETTPIVDRIVRRLRRLRAGA